MPRITAATNIGNLPPGTRVESRKVHKTTNLKKYCPIGATVELTFHPLETPLLGDGDGRPDDLCMVDVIARVNGTVQGWVVEHPAHTEVIIRTSDDVGYQDGRKLVFDTNEISSVVILKVGHARDAEFGRLRLTWSPDEGIAGNGVRIPKELISAVAYHRGYAYANDTTTAAAQLRAWRMESELSINESSMRRGCATCTLKELDAALDWCAERLWDYGAE